MPTFAEHLAALPADNAAALRGDGLLTITAPFVENAAEVEPGGVFVARMGRSTDGHRFIAQAIERGAAAVVGEQELGDLPVPYARVRDGQQALGYLAASYHDFPSRRLLLIGVTGTDGKTTTTTLIHSILRHATAGKVGFISTIAADFGGQRTDTGLHVTTPSAPDVQRYLARMVTAGLSHVVLEMTSHGLHQGRLNGVDVDVAVVTNITHEHLDYHGTWEAYRDAKAIMFRRLMSSAHKGQPKTSVLNADDPGSYDYLRAIPAERIIAYGLGEQAELRPQAVEYTPQGIAIYLGDFAYRSALIGVFNVANILAAIGAAHALGIDDPQTIQAGLDDVPQISGRMERIDEGQDFLAMVDFAHTPNALEKALAAGRAMLRPGQRLIAVFGSAGLRDVQKRRLMAETSARLADITILTAEDPRTESLDDILEMMAEGCRSQGGVEGETFFRVPDRGAALYRACQMARPGDLVMACGKGHEQSMCFGTTEYPWDDREALRAALRGAPLRTLPTAEG
ncbi:MAG: UDP-N-acetylmuramoyl-L-alanyl-D-glutamate--2,6-diaminopimelate ligase [Anaerolineae bacterium]|nr:UDP-N-acetylmuramoyl-L-alanyl-D-glutamate--2,6-diaminopimelate ligase [Anaerolineae bacterium]